MMRKRTILGTAVWTLTLVVAVDSVASAQLFRRRSARATASAPRQPVQRAPGTAAVSPSDSAPATIAAQPATRVSNSADHDCDTTSILSCLPKLVSSCHCTDCTEENVTGTPPGKLKVVCNTTTFYEKCLKFKGTIPVPYVSIDKSEVYHFRPTTLCYDCEGKCPDGTDCKEDCHDKCNDKCKVASCELFKKTYKCDKQCELRSQTGSLWACLRRDSQTVDVYIGPNNTDFPEYPSNLVVLTSGSESQFQELQPDGAKISFADIKTQGSTDSPF